MGRLPVAVAGPCGPPRRYRRDRLGVRVQSAPVHLLEHGQVKLELLTERGEGVDEECVDSVGLSLEGAVEAEAG
eukprot:scaffold23411_cov84-Isochrysis_galbana.AAC.2